MVGRTIPDLISHFIGFVEAKDRIAVYLDKQMQKMVDAARNAGMPLNVVVSPKAEVVSVPLQQAVAQTRGKVYSRGTDGTYEEWGVGK